MIYKKQGLVIGLYALAIILIAIGFTYGFIDRTLNFITVSTFSIGCVLLLWVCMNVLRFGEKKCVWALSKRGMCSMIIFGVTLVCIVGINNVVYKSDIRWDLTQYKQHTLSQATVSILQDLNMDIKMTVLYVGVPEKYLIDLLKEYKRKANGSVSFEIIDPLLDIGYAAQFGNTITGKDRKLIVQTHGDFSQRFDVDFSKDVITEESVNNAILNVMRVRREVCFLTGHNEFSLTEDGAIGLSKLKNLLEANNIGARSFLLGESDVIPEVCDVLVIAGPKKPLLKKEELIIHEYMKKGGDVLFLIEHIIVTTPDKSLTEKEMDLNPSLNRILNKWGIKVFKDVVVDINSYFGKDVGSPATKNYLGHQAIVGGLDYTFYVRPRTITEAPHRRETIRLAPLVVTQSGKDKSWGESDRFLRIKYDPNEDRKGPIAISYVGWEKKEEGDLSDTRFIVFTDADFLTNIYIDQLSNAQITINAVNWLMELDYKVYPQARKVRVEKLELTSLEKRKVIVILILMSLSIPFLGFFVRIRTV